MEFLLWIGLIAVIVGLVWFLDNRNKKIVIEKSEKVKALMLLNNTVHFKTLRAKYNNYQACNTKRQFDNFSINDYLVALIEEKEN
ncbi:MAG: hypothetical protein IIX01_02960, partial [Clostridia bacterium]|nr:hypothetical protein [Clostridia bacterium]